MACRHAHCSHRGPVSYRTTCCRCVSGPPGLPRALVDVRHEATHNELPSLPLLRAAADSALAWLRDNYWWAEGGAKRGRRGDVPVEGGKTDGTRRGQKAGSPVEAAARQYPCTAVAGVLLCAVPVTCDDPSDPHPACGRRLPAGKGSAARCGARRSASAASWRRWPTAGGRRRRRGSAAVLAATQRTKKTKTMRTVTTRRALRRQVGAAGGNTVRQHSWGCRPGMA